MLEIFQQFPEFFFFFNSLTTSSPSLAGSFGAQSLKQERIWEESKWDQHLNPTRAIHLLNSFKKRPSVPLHPGCFIWKVEFEISVYSRWVTTSAKREANADTVHPDTGTTPRWVGQKKFGTSSEAPKALPLPWFLMHCHWQETGVFGSGRFKMISLSSPSPLNK